MKIQYTKNFEKAYKNLPSNIQYLAEAKENTFRANPFHTSLNTHKLKGNKKDFWSFSVNHSYRILFKFAENQTIYFLDIGTHSIYK